MNSGLISAPKKNHRINKKNLDYEIYMMRRGRGRVAVHKKKLHSIRWLFRKGVAFRAVRFRSAGGRKKRRIVKEIRYGHIPTGRLRRRKVER